VLQGNWQMGAATQLKRSVVSAVIVGCALMSACGSQSGAGASPQSRSEVTQKSAFVFDDAPSAVVAAGDKALAEKNYFVALQRYEDAAKDLNEKAQGSAPNRLGELYERGLGVNQDWSRSFDLYQKSAILNNP
jgi:TPR repeat protein